MKIYAEEMQSGNINRAAVELIEKLEFLGFADLDWDWFNTTTRRARGYTVVTVFNTKTEAVLGVFYPRLEGE